MLRNTFVHLPGVGEKTERQLWQANCHNWEELLAAESTALPAGLRKAQAIDLLQESLDHYQAGRWRYFERCLPGGVKWRAFDLRRGPTLYVDIETNGYDNAITVLGIYDGAQFDAYVANENLDEALERLESAATIVTYNGSGFDMPIIRQRFPYHLFNHVHIDLMWPLRKLGFRGGLKRIERALGLSRSEETEQMDGMDAVYLWRAYQQGSQEAKQLLLKYNEEDVRNLEPLMEWVYRELTQRIELTLRE